MEIRIAAAAILRRDGATLLVRKRGTLAFMQPGGKIDYGETPVMALCRELQEELGLNIQPKDAVYLGQFSAPAANEPDCIVTADMFRLHIDGDIVVRAEIAEIRWLHPGMQDDLDLAPLTRDAVLPVIWGQAAPPPCGKTARL